MTNNKLFFRDCLLAPVPEIAQAAEFLNGAVTAHIEGRFDDADRLIREANMKAIFDWTEMLWGKDSQKRWRVTKSEPRMVASPKRGRIPDAVKEKLLKENGYHCSYCGIPLVSGKVRERIRKAYSNALPWGGANEDKHYAFQAMDVQFDHIIPSSHHGLSDFTNLVVTCAPCNCGRMGLSLEEAGLNDPRNRAKTPIFPSWDGLERFPAN